MKPKPNSLKRVAAFCEEETGRFNRRAERLALRQMLNPDPALERLVREHLIRAETFMTCARICRQPSIMSDE